VASKKPPSDRTTKRRGGSGTGWGPPGPDGQTIRLDPSPGHFIGRDERFRIVDPLDAGGMGNVFRAEDKKFPENPVALKFLNAELIASDTAWKRAVREAQVTHGLMHPNIVRLVDYDNCEYGLYLALELVEGESLRKVLEKKTKFDLDGAVKIVIQIASALAAAHGRNVIHRDIKPENVMLTPDGTVKVVDFGIAHVVGRERVTKSGQIMTWAYAAPEQQDDKDDPRSDLFSLGCIFYELLAGEHAFWEPGMTMVQLMARMRDGRHKPVPPAAGELTDLLRSLLAPDAAHRPESARYVYDFLDNWRRPRLMPIKSVSQPGYVLPIANSVPNGKTRRGSVDAGVSGIAEIWLSRNEFDIAYDLEEVLGRVANGGRVRVIGKTLMLLLSQSEVLRKAISAGVSVELALIDPRAGEALFKRIPDVHIDDLAPAVRNFVSLAHWVADTRPSGSFQVRYHDEPLTDSFTEYESAQFCRVIWELSFGQSRNAKRVLVLDPTIGGGLGNDVKARYAKIWDSAKTQFVYRNRTVDVPLTRDLHDYGHHTAPHRRLDTVPDAAKHRIEFDLRPATDNDIAWMGALERKYFRRAAVPEGVLREWFGANGSGFSVLELRGGRRVGFLNILPIRADTLQKLKRGEIVEKEVGRSMLYREHEREAIRELYIECLLIDEHRPRGLRYLLAHVRKLIREVCIPERVRKLYALAATEEGSRVLRDLGFKPHLKNKQRRDGLTMFSITTFDLVLSCSKYLDDDDERENDVIARLG
jgi:serine/threonine protein kinase